MIFNISLPHECALRDSHAVGLIEPNAGLLMVCAFCYGWLDGTLNTQLIALIGQFSFNANDQGFTAMHQVIEALDIYFLVILCATVE